MGAKNMQARKSKDEWAALIEEQSESGLSKIKFCQEKGIALSRFYYHQNQLKTGEQKESAEGRSQALKNTIIPIQIKSETAKRSDKGHQIKLVLKNGMKCILPSEIDKKSLKEIIEVLLSC
jgi:hypothetical protein